MRWLITVLFGLLMNPVVWLIIAFSSYASSYAKKEKRSQTTLSFESVGEALKYYREKKKYSQEYVARQLGVTRQAVSKWETNLSEPSTHNLISLAKLYNVSVDELISLK